MKRLVLLSVAFISAGCVVPVSDEPVPEYVLTNSAIKADGSDLQRIILTPRSPDAVLRIPCNDWWGTCDATLDAIVTNIEDFDPGAPSSRHPSNVEPLLTFEAEWIDEEQDNRENLISSTLFVGHAERNNGVAYSYQCMNDTSSAEECREREDRMRALTLHSEDAKQEFTIRVHASWFGTNPLVALDVRTEWW